MHLHFFSICIWVRAVLPYITVNFCRPCICCSFTFLTVSDVVTVLRLWSGEVKAQKTLALALGKIVFWLEIPVLVTTAGNSPVVMRANVETQP